MAALFFFDPDKIMPQAFLKTSRTDVFARQSRGKQAR